MTMQEIKTEIVEKDPQTFAIIGAAMEVHRTLGKGFLEAVYSEALGEEFLERSIPSQKEVTLPIRYKAKVLTCFYRADFICYGEVLVELKALEKIGGVEQAQVINYLKATGLRRAIILNFGAYSLDYKRIVL